MNAPTAARQAARESRFRGLYDAAYGDLLRFVQRRTHATLAEDVVAEAWLVAWRRLDEVPADHGDARAWLFGVARNALLNSQRSRRRHEALAVRVGEAHARDTRATEAASGWDDLVARRLDLAEAWPRLSATDQESISLAVWDGLTAPEAAAVLGITATAYRLRLSRGRRALRRLLRDQEPGPATAREGPTTAREGSQR